MVPKEYDKDPKLAGHWVILQRCYYKKDKLLPNRIDLLMNSIDFEWEVVISAEFKKKSGRPYVSKTRSVQKSCVQRYYGTTTPLQRRIDPKLGKWVSYQRHAYKNNKLLRSS